MELRLSYEGRDYRVAYEHGVSLGRLLDFAKPELAVFGAALPRQQTMQAEGFVGAVDQGGSCNVSELSFNPHCHGTHTESVGHLLQDERYALPRVLTQSLFIARLLSFADEEELRMKLTSSVPALVLRTKQQLSAAALRFLVEERAVQQLLLEAPSLDPMQDGGALHLHRLFWNLAPRYEEQTGAPRSERTITELIELPSSLTDGLYLLNLSPVRFLSDAAPVNPILYPLELK